MEGAVDGGVGGGEEEIGERAREESAHIYLEIWMKCVWLALWLHWSRTLLANWIVFFSPRWSLWRTICWSSLSFCTKGVGYPTQNNTDISSTQACTLTILIFVILKAPFSYFICPLCFLTAARIMSRKVSRNMFVACGLITQACYKPFFTTGKMPTNMLWSCH